jgi:hypothetical protein
VAPSDGPLTYQIRVSLDGVRPPIWRRIVVPGRTTLAKLHDILQVVMGWEDYHLHQFTIAGKRYGDPEHDEGGELGFIDERRHTLQSLLPAKGGRLRYEYDFGDGWEHTLVVEKIVPTGEEGCRPVCVAGERACPPEDVGGVWGYEEYLTALQDPEHPGHDEWLQWRGEFDPEAFDPERVNAELERLAGSARGGEWDEWRMDHEPGATIPAPAPGWVEAMPEDLLAVAESLPLRLDALAFLAYLRDHKVTGTQATGNLPLQVAREIGALFADPPRFEDTIGERTYRVRSAADVWPLYFVHVLASVGGLASGGRGRRWRLSPAGEAFAEALPAAQVFHLLATWWTRANWMMALGSWSVGEALSPAFAQLARLKLLALPAERASPFAPFADELIAAGGLVTSVEDPLWARDLLRASVERMVLHPLARFGAAEPDYRARTPDGGYTFEELSAFRVTRWGRRLLEALPA